MYRVVLPTFNQVNVIAKKNLVFVLRTRASVIYLVRQELLIQSHSGKRKLHNLAQAAHCAAQGKVGSGFDVASAVYGSCLYRRFSPSILSAHGEPGTPEFGKQLIDIVDESGTNGQWDTEIIKDQVKVPEGIRLVMCDVSCGSQTPGMVKQVLAWRKDTGAEAEKVWEGLQDVNEGLSQELVKLAESGSKDYSPLRQRIQAIRKGIREMSEQSGVPIEPPAQTGLLDACSKVDGVIGGVVPGAGGYDAVALLIEDREEVVQKLQGLLSSWKIEGEADGSMGRVSMLGVKQEMEGVRVEQSGKYAEWWSE
ncbi:ERG8, Phosphomevalonate kinase [Aureobasidium pullulans]|uniref:phosphomevalonate kinase n=1 Tax=Aureobasidium pullulans TaxID=5580 RepID=A0A4T0DIP9_AURPU|nr:ERG8, Phosphomevalonate kinase [Aureobasidium pullulans]